MTARLGDVPLTNAQKQARHRTRRANKLARYEAALREIAESSLEWCASEYESGLSDGYKYSADIARQALATPTTQS